ncbi:MAG: glycosyltransferase family 4 protein [Planctomycetes bacterium]|nr:glycosyltransferase family 4 protein [Planctomycetota bacterium]
MVQRESLSLSKKGHQVTVVAMHDESRSVPAGIELLALPMDTLTRCKRIKTMWRVYQISRRRPFDVYHAHEVESLAVGILLKWRTGAELVFDAHECFHFTAARFSTGLRAQIISTLTSRMLRWMSRRAAHVIAVSFTNEKFYREYCGCRRVTIIHNSPPPDSFQYKNKPAEAVRTITHDGYLDESRGQDQILHALAIIKRHMPVKLLVVGQVSERSRASFAQRVKKLGLSNEIEVTGWLPYEQVGITLNRGSIGLVAMQPTPNNYGSLSNKLFNYMSTGQAVVGPKGSDTAEVIRQANCGALADMTDPQALAEAVMPLLADPDHCRQLGMNGRRAIEQKFGWHKMEETLGNIYESLDH